MFFFRDTATVPSRSDAKQAGAETRIVSPGKGEVRAWNHRDWGDLFPIDLALEDASEEDFDALLLPGGVMNPDKLCMIPEAVRFVKDFFDAGKPVASICHGPWIIVEADLVRDRTVTSWPSLKKTFRMPVVSGLTRRWSRTWAS
jgi:protease I